MYPFGNDSGFTSRGVPEVRSSWSRSYSELTAVVPVEDVEGDSGLGDVAETGPRPAEPALLTDRLTGIPVEAVAAVVVPARVLASPYTRRRRQLTVEVVRVRQLRPASGVCTENVVHTRLPSAGLSS